MQRSVLVGLSFLILFVSVQSVMAKVPMAKLCGMCHDPEPGVMMGFLENIAIKSGTIQMDFMTHKEVVKFNKDTTVEYVNDFKDIRNYLKKGFQINYIEKDGVKIAEEIIRFDILKVIEDEDKLSREDFLKLLNDPKAKVFDVRPPVKYKMGFIPGAGILPAPAFDKIAAKKLPKDKSTPIVYYGPGGCLSPTALVKTKALGYENVRIYTGGFPDWSKNYASIVAPDWLKMAIKKDIPHVLIDLRSNDVVKQGHIKGAVAIEYEKLAANKDRFPDRKNAPIIFYGEKAKAAANLAVSWGYKVSRVLPVSFDQWKKSGGATVTGDAKKEISYVPKPKPGTIPVEEFEKMAAKIPANATLIDVRNPDELKTGSVKGSLNIPVDSLGQRLTELDKNKELILFCNSGIRAEMAHTVLKEKGVKNRYLNATISFDDGELDIEEN